MTTQHVERFNCLKLQWILNHQDQIINTHCSDWKNDPSSRWNQTPADMFGAMHEYLARSRPTDIPGVNEIDITYKRVDKGSTGRRYASAGVSLQRFMCSIRNCITYGVYSDVDMSNAGPCILQSLCSKWQLSCSHLDEYIQHREKILTQIGFEMTMTRAQAKHLMIQLMNGSAVQISGQWLHAFRSDIRDILDYVDMELPELVAKRDEMGKTNPVRSALSTIVYEQEDIILQCALDTLPPSVRRHTALCFDGMLVPLSYDLNIHRINLAIMNTFDYLDLKFAIKSFNDEFQISESDLKKISDGSSNMVFADYPKVRAEALEFEKKWHENERGWLATAVKAKIDEFLISTVAYMQMQGEGMYALRSRTPQVIDAHGVKQDGMITYAFAKSGKLAYTDECVPYRAFKKVKDIDTGKNKLVPIITRVSLGKLLIQLRSDGRLKYYDQIVYAPWFETPIKVAKGSLNLFTGWYHHDAYIASPVLSDEEIDEVFADCGLIDHIDNVICSGNTELSDYFHSWIAHIIQRPRVRGAPTLLLIGLQGSGKTIMSSLISCILGSNYCMDINDQSKLVQRFNGHLVNLAYAMLNEIQCYSGLAANDRLKSIQTDESHIIEFKHMKPFETKNYMHLMATSNHDFACRISPSDRRWVVCDVSPARIGDTKYFETLYMHTRENASLLFRYYGSYDISDWDFRRIPLSKLKNQMKMDSSDTIIHRFVIELVNNKQVITGNPVPTTHLYTIFKRWADEAGEMYGTKISRIAFSKKLGHLGFEHARATIGNQQRRSFMIDVDKIQCVVSKALGIPACDLFDEI